MRRRRKVKIDRDELEGLRRLVETLERELQEAGAAHQEFLGRERALERELEQLRSWVAHWRRLLAETAEAVELPELARWYLQTVIDRPDELKVELSAESDDVERALRERFE